jgi:Domain of unknown function (DUF4388)
MALTGKFSETPFTDLIQFYAASRQTVAVMVNLAGGPGEDGVFYLEDGEVVDAFLGDAVGPDAVRRAMHLADGSFRIEPDIRAAERTVTEPLQRLLERQPMQGDERPGEQVVPPTGEERPATRAPAGATARLGEARPSTIGPGHPPAAPAPGSTPAQPGPATRPHVRDAGKPGRRGWALAAATAIVLLLVGGGVYSRCAASHPAQPRAPAPPVNQK